MWGEMGFARFPGGIPNVAYVPPGMRMRVWVRRGDAIEGRVPSIVEEFGPPRFT